LDVGDLTVGEVSEKKKVENISELEGVTPEIVEKLATANLTLAEQLKGLGAKDLVSIEGITKEEAGLIVKAMKKVV
jgi:hypothetical protein